MPYNPELAERIQSSLYRLGADALQKKMFGGIVWMIDDKMCIGIIKDALMARIDPDDEENLLTRRGAQPMEFTGRRMRGFMIVNPEGIQTDLDLDNWIQLCLDYNPRAKSSKKKK